MTVLAEDQCLPLPGDHRLHPKRFLFSTLRIEVCQFPDVVDLHLDPTPAELALIGKDPLEQFVAAGCEALGRLVFEDGYPLAAEEDASEPGDERFLSFSDHSDLV